MKTEKNESFLIIVEQYEKKEVTRIKGNFKKVLSEVKKIIGDNCYLRNTYEDDDDFELVNIFENEFACGTLENTQDFSLYIYGKTSNEVQKLARAIYLIPFEVPVNKNCLRKPNSCRYIR